MFRSIRFRLALWYTVIVALTFVVVAVVIYKYVETTLSASLDQSVVGESEWLAARYERHLLRGAAESDGEAREDIFEHASYFPMKEYAEVWDSNGHLFYHSPNLGSDTLATFAFMVGPESRALEMIQGFRNHRVRLLVRRERTSTVFLGMPMETVTQPLAQLVKIYVLLAPVVLLIGVLVGAGLARKSFRRINEIIETARRITAEHLEERIPEQVTQDEVGRIISTFNQMISRLDVSFRQLKQFSADASHELRTPLSVMRTQLETALLSTASISDLKLVAANCLDETLRMSSIIDSLLLLARADAKKEVLALEPVNLARLVEETADDVRIIAAEHRIGVALKTSDDAVILGEKVRLRQMLMNIIDNAVKYNRPDGTIEIGLEVKDGAAELRVTDTGIGISAQELPRIFDRFYRVDRARSREMGGTGLGLSIVHWIVTAHGGHIGVTSVPEKGTEFTVTFPLFRGSGSGAAKLEAAAES